MTSTNALTIAVLVCDMLVVAAGCWIAHAAPQALADMAPVLSTVAMGVSGLGAGVGMARQGKKALGAKPREPAP